MALAAAIHAARCRRGRHPFSARRAARPPAARRARSPRTYPLGGEGVPRSSADFSAEAAIASAILGCEACASTLPESCDRDCSSAATRPSSFEAASVAAFTPASSASSLSLSGPRSTACCWLPACCRADTVVSSAATLSPSLSSAAVSAPPAVSAVFCTAARSARSLSSAAERSFTVPTRRWRVALLAAASTPFARDLAVDAFERAARRAEQAGILQRAGPGQRDHGADQPGGYGAHAATPRRGGLRRGSRAPGPRIFFRRRAVSFRRGVEVIAGAARLRLPRANRQGPARPPGWIPQRPRPLARRASVVSGCDPVWPAAPPASAPGPPAGLCHPPRCARPRRAPARIVTGSRPAFRVPRVFGVLTSSAPLSLPSVRPARVA